jgi:hypothetical protein
MITAADTKGVRHCVVSATLALTMRRCPLMVRVLGFILITYFPIRSYAQVNFYYYQNFDISGPSSVCIDGTTVHNYSGPSESLTWSISGGEFVGNNTGISVSVKWNSESMTISATGVESVCYYDPEIYPPVLYCDVTTYTSNPFNLSSSIVTGYGLSAGPYYLGTSGATVTLSGSQVGVSYQLKINGSPSGSPLSGTGSALVWNNQTAYGPYTVTATKSSPSCSISLASSVTITMQGPLVSPANPPAISYGESIQLSISGTYYSIQWFKGGASIDGATQLQYSAYEPGVYLAQVRETSSGPLLNSSSVTVPSAATPVTYSNAKLVEDVVLTTNDGTKTYLITKRLALSPGAVPLVLSGASGPYVFKMTSNRPQKVPPSMDQNFVRTESVLIPGIKLEAAMMNLDITQKGVTYEYGDGVGRNSQTVAVKASPGMSDVVQPFTYSTEDPNRIENEWLPFSVSTQNGSFRTNALPTIPPGPVTAEIDQFYDNATKVSHDTKRNTQITYEKSPLNRITEINGMGAVWASNSKKSLSSVLPSGPGIPRWQINSEGLPQSAGNYTENLLFRSQTTDENGNVVVVYTDMRGLTVRTEHDNLVTVNIFDEFGNLRFVIPPKLSSNFTPDQAVLNNWAFQYEYNDRQLLRKEKGPGTDWVFYVYDQWDRLVATQDGNQRAKTPASAREWTFFKYDAFNRPIVTGILTSGLDISGMELAVAGGHHEDRSTASPIGYTLSTSFPTPASFPSVIESNLLTINYYDDYGFIGSTNWELEGNTFTFSNPGGFSNVKLDPVKGQMTGSKTRILNSNSWLNAVIYYDNKYRPIQAIQENHLGGKDVASFEYNFPGWTMKSYRSHATTYGSVGILEEFEYDHTGRLLKSWNTMDGGTRTLLASNSYNELGQLVESNLHSTDNGTSYLQSVDYRYNIRGWLTHINNSTLTNDIAGADTNDDTNDLFGLQIVYNEETPVVNASNTVARQYNGNISAIKWKTDNKKDTPKERIYGFQYDTKDRLTKSFYAANTGSTWTDEGGLYDEDNLDYDENGNLKTLRRYAKIAGSAAMLDNLNYNTLGASSVNNQLLTVEDTGNPNVGFVNGANGQTTEYQFDANGNMEEDMNSAVTLVQYNYLDLPEKVVINGGTSGETSVEFTYDASGYLLRKIYKRGTSEESRVDYVNGIQYTNSSLAVVFTPYGRATKYNTGWEYEYFLKDHQGNTRLAFGNLHEVNTYKATMETPFAGTEESAFKKISSTRYTDVSPFTYNHTARSTYVPIPDKSSRLNGSVSGLEVGPGKVLNINSGEKLRMEVYARYNPGSGNASDVVASLVSAATTSLNVTVGENPAAYNAFNTYLPGFVNSVTYNTGEPKAYLNYILFDASHGNPQFGFVVVPGSAAVKWEKLSISLSIPSIGYNGGYAYVYLTNESNYNVFFDDFLIVHEKSNMALRVTESADYYPFGLLIEGTRYEDEGRLANAYGYQGDYSEFDSRTGWNRFALRGNYDSRLGRWQSGDPYQQFASPYVGMGNSAINGTDPNGGFFFGIFARLLKAMAKTITSYFSSPVEGAIDMGLLQEVVVTAPRIVEGVAGELIISAPTGILPVAGGVAVGTVAMATQTLPSSNSAAFSGTTANPSTLPQRPPSAINFQEGDRGRFSIDLAVNRANFNAHDTYKAAKAAGDGARCARFVRWALEAGFRMPTNALQGKLPVPARLYGPYLERMGFTPMNTSTYLDGDIAVIDGYAGGTADPVTGKSYGHIQIFDGKSRRWVSSWKQRGDFWPGPNYENANPNYQIFRWSQPW